MTIEDKKIYVEGQISQSRNLKFGYKITLLELIEFLNSDKLDQVVKVWDRSSIILDEQDEKVYDCIYKLIKAYFK